MEKQVKFNRVPEKVPNMVPEKVWEALVVRRMFRRRSGGLWCRARSSLIYGSGEGSGEGSREGLGGFGAEPGQVQQGSGEGSGEGSG